MYQPKGPCYVSAQNGLVMCQPNRVLLCVRSKGSFYLSAPPPKALLCVSPKVYCYVSTQKDLVMCQLKRVLLCVSPKGHCYCINLRGPCYVLT